MKERGIIDSDERFLDVFVYHDHFVFLLATSL